MPSVKIQEKDTNGIIEILNDNKDKTSNSDHLLSSKAKTKNVKEGEKTYSES